MMGVYLDASVLVSLFVNESNTARAQAFLAANRLRLLVSDLASAEFASALNRRVRLQEIRPDDARSAFMHFDTWVARKTEWVPMAPADVKQAQSVLRQLELPLRTPDALNIAIAARLGATLATFDLRMAECAARLGIQLSDL